MRYLVLGLIFLAGCASGPADQEPPAPPPDPSVTSFSVTLPELGTSEWLLYEVAPRGPQQFNITYEESYPLESEWRHCVMVQLAHRGYAGMGSASRLTVSASAVQRGPLVDQSAIDGMFTTSYTDTVRNEGRPTYLLVGFEQAKLWQGDGAVFNYTVTSSGRFVVTPIARGEVQCATEPNEFPEGEYLESPDATLVTDLVDRFEITQTGHGWLFVSSDLGYEYHLVGPAGEVTSETAQPGQSGEGFQMVVLPPGSYSIEIPRLQGSQQVTTSYIVVDLPANATADFAVQ